MFKIIIICLPALAGALEDYASYFSSSVIQKYQPPVDMLRFIENSNGIFMSENVQKYDGFYVKKNISRILGLQRIADSIALRDIKNCITPVKYLFPVFNSRGYLDIYKSRIISLHIENSLIKDLSDEEVCSILTIVQDSKVYDINFTNLRRNSDGRIVIIDTELQRDDIPYQIPLMLAFSFLKRYSISLEIKKWMTEKEAKFQNELLAQGYT